MSSLSPEGYRFDPVVTVLVGCEATTTSLTDVIETEPSNVEHMLVGRSQSPLKGKVLPYSLPSAGPGADRGVQAVSPQVT